MYFEEKMYYGIFIEGIIRSRLFFDKERDLGDYDNYLFDNDNEYYCFDMLNII